ncbi:rod shape-determining protein MreD [bacterium]|nr:rod shape-determining protein MreD [bacterium]
MKRALKVSSVIFVLLYFQTAGARLTSLNFLFPDFLLIFLVFRSAGEKIINAVIIGFIAGLFQDLVAGSVPGIFALSKGLACYFSVFLYSSLSGEHNLVRIIGFSVPLFIHFLVLGMLSFLGNGLGFFDLFLRYSFSAFLVTLGAGFIIDIWMQQTGKRVEAW